MVALNFDKVIPIKVPPMLPILNSTNIECLIVSLKEKIVVGLHCLLVLEMEERMTVNA